LIAKAHSVAIQLNGLDAATSHITHHKLREAQNEFDVEIVIQRASPLNSDESELTRD
jgi:hypothetical protein